MGTSMIQCWLHLCDFSPLCVFKCLLKLFGINSQYRADSWRRQTLMGTSMIRWLRILLAYNGSESLADLVAGSSLNRALLRINKSIFYHQLPNSYTYAQSLQT